jgi:uncharacterized protein YndB with AHSA1/START domain
MAKKTTRKKKAKPARKKARKTEKARKATRKPAARKPAAKKRTSISAAAPIVEALAIGAPVERVWQALTSPRDLELLTLGRVTMDPKPGAPFQWHWGIWEQVAPAGKKSSFVWKGTVLDVVPGSTLVLGPYPLVTITVIGEGDSSLVTVVQAPPAGGDSEDYEEGWADFLLKLKTQLETRHWEREILARSLVSATPAKTLGSLLDDKAMKKILPGKTKTAARVGKEFSWEPARTGQRITGKFLEVRKGRRLNFTWQVAGAASSSSVVAIEALPMPYGTLVSVHHIGLAAAARQAPLLPFLRRKDYRQLILLERIF